MSISQFLLLGAWVIYGIEQIAASGIKPGLMWPLRVVENRFGCFFRQREAIIFILIFLLHGIGLLWTSDLPFGLHDLRIKLPLLLLPIVFSTLPALNQKTFNTLLFIYLFALLAASAECIYILFTENITDIRDISTHISHVRLALNFVAGIFFGGYYLFSGKATLSRWQRIVAGLLSGWFLFFLIFMKSPTGIIVFILTTTILFFIYALKIQQTKIRYIIPAVIVLSLIAGVGYLSRIVQEYYSATAIPLEKLEPYTDKNNRYTHDTIHFPGIENGNYIGYYICQEELQQQWEKRSQYSYFGKDAKQQELKVTLIRYLNSKGLRKDASGIAALSDSDIRAIEGGVANYYYISKFNIRGRVYQMLFGLDIYRRDNNPNGSSMLQRREYWKAGFQILRHNLLTGVGTGDLRESFTTYYEQTDSALLPEYRHRAHNQFLSIAIAFGIPGIVLFLFALLYPPVALKAGRSWHFSVLIIIVILSMLTEDTLETQAGVTFTAFLYCLFLWGRRKPAEKSLKTRKNED